MSVAWDLSVEPWRLRETGFDLDQLGRTESLFALSNGYLGIRGNLDEGEPNHLPGTYLNGCYESYPLSYAEAGYGYPESGELLINVTDGKVVRLLVDDEPLDLREGRILHAERILDFRAGTLRRSLRWRSPAGQVVAITSTRLVSFTQRAVLAVDYRVEAVEREVRLAVQSELRANQDVEETSGNPALTTVVAEPLVAEQHGSQQSRCHLVHRTRRSGLRVAVAAEHRVEGTAADVETTTDQDCACTTITAVLRPGEQLRLAKFVAYGCSSGRSADALRDESDAALDRALSSGWGGLAADQRRYLDNFWDCADVAVDGDAEVQQGVRFGLFHLVQASARAEQRPIPAKGLTGTGYSGHAFWETEMFVLPVLTALSPAVAADALAWRHATLPMARERAATLRQRGASPPWRTISGRECGAYWPAGTAAFHVNADVAAAVTRYVAWTGDEDFERTRGLDLLVETARLWISLGYHGGDGRFHIDGVTGPDEYSALVDDNTYTNVMAAQNLRDAARAARHWRSDADRCQVSEEEIVDWVVAAESMAVPHDRDLDMPQQHRDSTRRQRWDFAATERIDGYPLQDHYPYVEIYRKQVVKQADLVLAMHWRGDRFSHDAKARAFAFYEELTVRDSSLSASSQAVLAAELGHLDLAHAYVREAALMDLDDLDHNTADGLHMASLAGGWIGLVCGFGGLRDHGGRLCLSPRLPATVSRLSFSLRWRGSLIRVVIVSDRVEYLLLGPTDQPPSIDDDHRPGIELVHDGRLLRLEPDRPVRADLTPAAAATEPPRQPAGRAPRAGPGLAEPPRRPPIGFDPGFGG
jgi:alpha,alpha-trehalose phosphorylase